MNDDQRPSFPSARIASWLNLWTPALTLLSTIAAAVAAWTSFCAVLQTQDAAREAREAQRPYLTMSPEARWDHAMPPAQRVELTIRNIGGRPATDVEGKVHLSDLVDRGRIIEVPIDVGTEVAHGAELVWTGGEDLSVYASTPALLAVTLRYSDPVLAESFEQAFVVKWDEGEFRTATEFERAQALPP